MIKFQATSLIHNISPVLQVTERFQKRELVLNDSWTDRDGQLHPNFVVIEFSGDKMSLLDNFAPGQKVTVEVVVNGRESKNGNIFHTLRGQSIYHYQPSQQQYPQNGYPAPQYPQQPPQAYPQGGYNAPMPGYQPQQGFPQQPPQGYPQGQGYSNQAPQYPQSNTAQQQFGHTSAPGASDLPFPHN